MKPSAPLRAVYDCMIFLQATINETSPAAELFRQVEQGNVALFVSAAILSEVRDVLTRPKIQAKNPHLTEEYVESFLRRVMSQARLLPKAPQRFTYSRDPNDEPYLNLAIETEAAYLVSRDNDLLDLMNAYTDEAKDFRRRFRRLKVVNPAEFLAIIKGRDLGVKP